MKPAAWIVMQRSGAGDYPIASRPTWDEAAAAMVAAMKERVVVDNWRSSDAAMYITPSEEMVDD